METYWRKYFKVEPDDPDKDFHSSLSEKQFPSWSKSKLSDMVGASIHVSFTDCEGIEMLLMMGPGEYHQSDDYQAQFPSNIHKLVRRRLQFRLPDGQWLTKEINMDRFDIQEYVSLVKI